MVDKPSKTEDEYFAREDAEKLHRLASEKAKQLTAAEKEARKQQHWMKCGKCGYDLKTIRWRNVDVDKCFNCGVILLDDGELEKLAGAEDKGGFFRSLIDTLGTKS